jgi:hypothetical protein
MRKPDNRNRWHTLFAVSALTLAVGGCGGGGTSSGGGLSRTSVSGVVENFQTAWLQFRPSAPEDASFASVVGRWLIPAAQAGLGGVDVTLTCGSSPQQSMVTGADGHFYFGSVTPGDNCTLDFAYAGSSATLNLTVKPGENTHNVSIAGGRAVELEISSSGGIKGEVEDDDDVAHADDKDDDHDDDDDDDEDDDKDDDHASNDDEHDDLSKSKKG